MDASEPQEPSYYEVALTNRQVLVAFVALLTCLLVAFLAGVWIGRGGTEAAQAQAAASTSRSAVQEPPLEQLSFFNGSPTTGAAAAKPPAAAAPLPKPAVAPPVVEPAPAPTAASAADDTEAMRQNLEATMAANRETPAMKMAAGERTGTPPATAEPAAPATASTVAKSSAPPAAKPAAAGKTFVQVYSSNNGERAREIVAKLRKAGFPVVLAEAPKGSGKNFRVRVGPYETRAKADEAAIRLRRDHRLDTWVTDSP